MISYGLLNNGSDIISLAAVLFFLSDKVNSRPNVVTKEHANRIHKKYFLLNVQ
jgi:hypothetical protein